MCKSKPRRQSERKKVKKRKSTKLHNIPAVSTLIQGRILRSNLRLKGQFNNNVMIIMKLQREQVQTGIHMSYRHK